MKGRLAVMTKFSADFDIREYTVPEVEPDVIPAIELEYTTKDQTGLPFGQSVSLSASRESDDDEEVFAEPVPRSVRPCDRREEAAALFCLLEPSHGGFRSR